MGMKVVVTKDALLQGLQMVQGVGGSKATTLPILSNVLIQATKQGVTLTTTDLDVSVRAVVEAQVDKAGATTLPTRRLAGIVRELQAGDIQIEVDEKHAAEVTSGASFFRILGLSEEEFPPVPKAEGKLSYRLEQVLFKEMLRKTAYAASQDETRYVLNGVLLSFKNGKLTVVATDGRRLALVETEVEFPKDAEADLVVPTKAVNELMHTLGEEGDLRIFAQGNQAVFDFGAGMVATKLIEGTYPNYRQVVPSQCEERVVVERESLLSALRRVALLASEKASATRLTFAKNKLIVAVTTPDIGEARETVPIKYSGKEIVVAFNPEYMMDPLRALTNDEIFIELTDDLSPGVIKCDMPFLYVLMPMRIS